MRKLMFLISLLLPFILFGETYEDVFEAIRKGNNRYAMARIETMKDLRYVCERLILYDNKGGVDATLLNRTLLDVAAIDAESVEMSKFLLPKVSPNEGAWFIPKKYRYKDGVKYNVFVKHTRDKKIVYKSTFYRVVEKGNLELITLFYKHDGDIFRLLTPNRPTNLFQFLNGKKGKKKIIKAALQGITNLPITDNIIEVFDSYGQRMEYKKDPVTIAITEGDFDAVDIFFRYGVSIKKEYLMQASANFPFLDYMIEKEYLTLEQLIQWNREGVKVLISLHEFGYIDESKFHELLMDVPQKQWNELGLDYLFSVYDKGYLSFEESLERFKAMPMQHLYIAIEHNRNDFAKALIEEETTEKLNQTAISQKTLCWHPDSSWRTDNNLKSLKEFGYNALEMAIIKGNTELVEFLLENGADPYHPRRTFAEIDSFYHHKTPVASNWFQVKTPLSLAIDNQQTELVELMMSYAEDPSLPVFSEGKIETDLMNQVVFKVIESQDAALYMLNRAK